MVKIDWVRIETAMAKRDLTHEKLAAQMGVKLETLKRYLITGQASYWAARQIARVLNVSIFDFVRLRR